MPPPAPPFTARPPDSVEEKIAEARRLYEAHKESLRGDPAITLLIDALDRALRASSEVMAAQGLREICRRCETIEGGSCCGAGIEHHYTPTLLLVNLLLATPLPDGRASHESCFFLGREGCRLKVRHALCVNYLCAKTRKILSAQAISQIQEAVGEELKAGFALCEALARTIRTKPGP